MPQNWVANFCQTKADLFCQTGNTVHRTKNSTVLHLALKRCAAPGQGPFGRVSPSLLTEDRAQLPSDAATQSSLFASFHSPLRTFSILLNISPNTQHCFAHLVCNLQRWCFICGADEVQSGHRTTNSSKVQHRCSTLLDTHHNLSHYKPEPAKQSQPKTRAIQIRMPYI